MLMLCTARPDLLEQRPGWAQEVERASRLAVEPLDDAGSRQLIADMLGTTTLPEAAARGSAPRPRATRCSSRR